MSKQLSFTKIENELLHKFRKKMDLAESTEDVKKFYAYTTTDLLNLAFEEKINFTHNDIELTPNKEPNYKLKNLTAKTDHFDSIWTQSDLPKIIDRFTATAVKHYKHLEKGPGKTESKIRM